MSTRQGVSAVRLWLMLVAAALMASGCTSGVSDPAGDTGSDGGQIAPDGDVSGTAMHKFDLWSGGVELRGVNMTASWVTIRAATSGHRRYIVTGPSARSELSHPAQSTAGAARTRACQPRRAARRHVKTKVRFPKRHSRQGRSDRRTSSPGSVGVSGRSAPRSSC